MLMHARDGTTIVTQQEKVKKETRKRLCSVPSFLLSRKHQYLFATGSFHFRTGQAKLSQANFYSIHFLKIRHSIHSISIEKTFVLHKSAQKKTFFPGIFYKRKLLISSI